jgi:hypothetical protein
MDNGNNPLLFIGMKKELIALLKILSFLFIRNKQNKQNIMHIFIGNQITYKQWKKFEIQKWN